MIISISLQFIILVINKLTFRFCSCHFLPLTYKNIYYGPKCSLLKVKCLMTIELIDSAAIASIKVHLKYIEANTTFPQETVQSFIPGFLREEKKGLGISTLNGITSAIRVRLRWSSLSMTKEKNRTEQNIAKTSVRKHSEVDFWLHSKRFISLVSFLFRLNVTFSSLFFFSLFTVDATSNRQCKLCAHLYTN